MRQISELVNRQMRQWEISREAGRTHSDGKPGPVVCLARDIGAGGRAVGKALAERLNVDLIGKETIDTIAEDLHQQRRLVDILDERGRQSLERWVEGYLHGAPVEYDEYAKALVKVVRAAALHGNVLFLGRGANLVLGLEHAFCVRIVAPFDKRVERVMEYLSLSREEAETTIRDTDRQRIEFARKVFHRDYNDPAAQHLTLNTGVFTDLQAVDLIVEAMKALKLPTAGTKTGN